MLFKTLSLGSVTVNYYYLSSLGQGPRDQTRPDFVLLSLVSMSNGISAAAAHGNLLHGHTWLAWPKIIQPREQ
jgi:hypothetical protein